MGIFDDPNHTPTNIRRIREHMDAEADRRFWDDLNAQNAQNAEIAAEQRAYQRQVAAEARAAQAQRAAEERAAVQAWTYGPDGHAFRDWKTRAQALEQQFSAREDAFEAAFQADLNDHVSDLERRQFRKKAALPKPARVVAADVLVTIGMVVLALDAVFTLVWWIISWFPPKFSTMLPIIIGAGVLGIVCIVLCWIVQDERWQTANKDALTAAAERRTAAFGFDPLAEPGRRLTWHDGDRPPFADWLDRDQGPSYRLPMKNDLPRIELWNRTPSALHAGHAMPRVQALLDSWGNEALHP